MTHLTIEQEPLYDYKNNTLVIKYNYLARLKFK